MSDRRGFTLVEAMLVMALIGILAGVGGVYLLSQLPNLRANGAARELVANFRMAKTLAVETGYEVYVAFDVAQNEYEVVRDTNQNGTYDSTDDQPRVPVSLPDSIEFYSGSGAPGGEVTFTGDMAEFYPRGTAKLGSVFLRPAQDAGVRTDRQRKITVIGTGRVRVEH